MLAGSGDAEGSSLTVGLFVSGLVKLLLSPPV